MGYGETCDSMTLCGCSQNSGPLQVSRFFWLPSTTVQKGPSILKHSHIGHSLLLARGEKGAPPKVPKRRWSRLVRRNIDGSGFGLVLIICLCHLLPSKKPQLEAFSLPKSPLHVLPPFGAYDTYGYGVSTGGFKGELGVQPLYPLRGGIVYNCNKSTLLCAGVVWSARLVEVFFGGCFPPWIRPRALLMLFHV